jgi:magnesium transporter
MSDGVTDRAREAGRGAVQRLRPRVRRFTGTAHHHEPGAMATGPAVVDCAVYEQGHRKPGQPSAAQALEAAEELPDRFAWLGLYEPSAEEFADVAREYGLPPLAVEDAVQAHQRPKLERYGDQLFLVLKSARYVEHQELTATTEVVETGEIMLFVGKDFVVSVRHGMARPLEVVRARLDEDPALTSLGPTAVLYAVADQIVDDYAVIANEIELDLDQLEERVFSSDAGRDPQRIYRFKRELSEFKRAVLPLVRPVHLLTEGMVAGVPPEIVTNLRDVQDHLLQTVEQVTAADDLLSSILDANLTQVALQQNDDMRKMSAWLAIVAVPTAVTGFYGMNVPYPGFGRGWGVGVAVGIIVCGGLILYLLFKRKRWL